jgi:hypothetical protein
MAHAPAPVLSNTSAFFCPLYYFVVAITQEITFMMYYPSASRRSAFAFINSLVEMTSSTFTDNSVADGTVSFQGGSLYAFNNVFKRNSATFSAGAISLSQLRAHLVGNVFEENQTTSYGDDDFLELFAGSECGGGAVAQRGGRLLVEDNLFEKNISTGAIDSFFTMAVEGTGGAVCLADVETTMARNTFLSNSALNEGGAVKQTGGSLLLFQNTFDTNTVGGVMPSNDPNVGGALFVDRGAVTAVQNEFLRNKAFSEEGDFKLADGGGAVALLGGSGLFENNLFEENFTSGTRANGGAMLIGSDELDYYDYGYDSFGASAGLTCNSFVNNESGSEGAGAVHAYYGSNVISQGNLYQGNVAVAEGGAIKVEQESTFLSLLDTFIGNTAVRTRTLTRFIVLFCDAADCYIVRP